MTSNVVPNNLFSKVPCEESQRVSSLYTFLVAHFFLWIVNQTRPQCCSQNQHPEDPTAQLACSDLAYKRSEGQ